MKYKCELIRDLLPLYTDEVTSDVTSDIVKEHLSECKECNELYSLIKNDEIVNRISEEKKDVISNQAKFFKRKSVIAGTVAALIFMIPILVCLIVNLATGAGLDWFFIVLASLLTAASLIIVPLMMPKNKGLWTFITFLISLILLFGVICIYTKGNWFFVAGISSVFGLCVVFLPFVLKSRPISRVVKNRKGLLYMAVNTLLYFLMMLVIGLFIKDSDFFAISCVFSIPVLILIWLMFLVIRYVGKSKLQKSGLCIALFGVFSFFYESVINMLFGYYKPLPGFDLFNWGKDTVYPNIKWLILLGCLLIGMILFIISQIKRSRKK